MPTTHPDTLGVAVEWNLDESEWENALARCPHATYFHTAAWLRTARRAFGSRIARVRMTLSDGRWALLPLSIRPLAKGLVRLACAGETGAFNGLVSPLSLTQPEVDAMYAAVRRRYPLLQVVGNPLAESPHLPDTREVADDALPFTHVLALKPLPELREGFSRGCKARGNKARKLGLTCRVSSDAADVPVFYRLYEDSVRRWGEKLTWAREESFFRAVVEEAGPEHAKIFIAYRDGEAVSALLFVSFGRATHYLAGATHADHLASCPSNLLMEEAMAFYHTSGCETFDFGSSNHLAGVIQFKESFGAHRLSFATRSFETPAGQVYFWLRDLVGRVRDRRRGGEATETTHDDTHSTHPLPAPAATPSQA